MASTEKIKAFKARIMLRWWFIVCISLFVCGGLYFLGVFHTIWDIDKTKISFIIMTLYMAVSTYIGRMIWYYHKHCIIKPNDIGLVNLLCDKMISLGLVGTVFGMMFMLHAFGIEDLDTSDPVQMTKLLTSAANGMYTALVTTATGIICNLLARLQLINIAYYA